MINQYNAQQGLFCYQNIVRYLKSTKTGCFGIKYILLFTRTSSGPYAISCQEYTLFGLMPKL